MSKISLDVLKEIASVRKSIQQNKKELNDYTDGKDDALDERANDNENATCELSENTETSISDLENAICEQSEMVETALADIENALCELTEQ